MASVSYDVLRIDHVHIPARSVFQRHIADRDIFCVADVEKARAHSAGNGVCVFIFLDPAAELRQIVFQPLPLCLDDPLREQPAAALDGPAAADHYIAACGAGGMVDFPEIQKPA